jgi:hypothetical protein
MADRATSNRHIAKENQDLKTPAITDDEGPATLADSVTISINESEISTSPSELAPHLRVIKPSRPSLTYERVE